MRKVVRHLLGSVAAAAPGLFGSLEGALEDLSDTPDAVSGCRKETNGPLLLGLCTGASLTFLSHTSVGLVFKSRVAI